jgi:hypothetical protein
VTPCPTPLASQKAMAASMASSPVATSGQAKGLVQRTFSDFGGTKASSVTGWPPSERDEGVDHRQVVLPREVEVALVVGRAAEDRAGAVVHQDEVGDVDRQFPVGSKGWRTRRPVS